MRKKNSVLIKKKITRFRKTILVESDKSISHRALLIASQCIGPSSLNGILESEDVKNTVICLKKLGVKILKKNKKYIVYGNGLESFKKPHKNLLYAGNSGTLARMLIGLLATHPNLKVKIFGDNSLNKRDMNRIIKPLSKIGCSFYPKNKRTLPLTIEGTSLPLAQKHFETIGSAQVKTAILLAALNTPGITQVKENKISRNHTENLLTTIKTDIKITKLKKGNLISLKGQKNLHAFDYMVSADPSSASFLIALTLLTPNSKLTIHNVLCNPNRIGFIKVLKEKMGANIKIKNLKKISEEQVGSIIVKSSKLKSLNCPKDLIPSLIDELPILFVVASLTKGVSKFTAINEATKKESNRIEEMRKIFSKLGIFCKSTKDAMIINNKNNIKIKNKSVIVRTEGDHRICMASTILALATGAKITIKNFETVNTSFPNFISLIKSIGGKIEIQKK